jgi:hypothetical protein
MSDKTALSDVSSPQADVQNGDLRGAVRSTVHPAPRPAGSSGRLARRSFLTWSLLRKAARSVAAKARYRDNVMSILLLRAGPRRGRGMLATAIGRFDTQVELRETEIDRANTMKAQVHRAYYCTCQ